jgi:hypothetical protein
MMGGNLRDVFVIRCFVSMGAQNCIGLDLDNLHLDGGVNVTGVLGLLVAKNGGACTLSVSSQ